VVRCKGEGLHRAQAVEGVKEELVKKAAMMILRKSLGSKSGVHKKVIERGHITSTIQGSRGLQRGEAKV
jgi:hypothetical protein